MGEWGGFNLQVIVALAAAESSPPPPPPPSGGDGFFVRTCLLAILLGESNWTLLFLKHFAPKQPLTRKFKFRKHIKYTVEEFLAVIARIDIFCLCEIEKCFSFRAQRANCTKKLRAIFAKFSPKRKTLKKIHYFLQSCTLLQYLPPPPPTTFIDNVTT